MKPDATVKTDATEEHLRYQIDYYKVVDREAIRPVDTPYVRRHFEQVRTAAQLDGAESILEIGSGSGRFTRLLLHQTPADILATDLSPELLQALNEHFRHERLSTLSCAVSNLSQQTKRMFDRAVGFFILHHLLDLDQAFAALADVLRPGARMAFCEPNGYHPLFYAQILCSPNMRWKAEKGIVNMRPKIVLNAMARQGFVDLEHHAYGFFPPFIANRALGQSLEAWLEGFSWLRPALTFQIFSGRKIS